MSLPNRKTTRAALVTDLKTVIGLTTEAGGQAHVFDHLVKDPGGISPFATVEDGESQYDLSGDDSALHPLGFVIGFWIRRDDASASESLLDDLFLALGDILRTKYMARFTRPSVLDYDILAGIEYRIEFHFVEIMS